MASVLTVVAKLEANAENFVVGMRKAAAATANLQSIASNSSQKMSGDMRGRFSEIGDGASKLGGMLKGLLGIFAGYKAVNFLKGAVHEASAFEAEFEGVNQAFKEGAPIVQEFAKNAAMTAGVTENAALKSAKSFGVYATSAGLAGKEQAKFATTLVQTAGDLGSFFDLPTEQALYAIQAGLRGESEPLRRFNIMIDQATIKQKAMEMGLWDGKGALDSHARILAANATILAQVGVAQGDFVKYADTYGNSIKTTSALWDNLQKDVGSALLPALAKLSGALVPIIAQLGPLMTQAVAALAPVITALTESFKYIIPILTPILTVIQSLATAFAGLATNALPLIGQMLEKVVPIIGTLGESFGNLIIQLTPAITALLTGLMPTFDELVDLLNAVVVPAISGIANWLGTWLPAAINTAVSFFNTFKPVILTITGLWIGLKLAMWAYAATTKIVAAWNTIMVGATMAETAAIWLATAAQWALNIAMDANPIGLLVAAIVLAIAAIAAIAAGIWYLATQTQFFQDTWAFLVKSWQNGINTIVNAFNSFWQGIQDIWNGIIDLFTGKGGDRLLKGVGEIWNGMLTLIRGYVNQIIDELNAVLGWTGFHVDHWLSPEEQARAVKEAKATAEAAVKAGNDAWAKGWGKWAIGQSKADAAAKAAAVTPEQQAKIDAKKQADAAQLKALQDLAANITKTLDGLAPIPLYVQKMGTIQKAVFDASKKVTEELDKALAAGTINPKQYKSLKAKYEKQFKELDAIAKKRDDLAERMAKRKAIYDNMFKDITDNANITKLGNSAEGIVMQLQRYYEGLQQYQENLRNLKNMGISDKLYEQIIGSGFQQGLLTSTALLSQPAMLSDIEALTANIDSIGGTIAQTSASSLYTSGQSAIGGFIDGLLSDQTALESAATKIATTLTKQVKADLGIKSPSKVFKGIGKAVGDGFHIGLAEGNFPSTALNGVSVNGNLGLGSSANAGNSTYNITVNAGVGANGEDIGKTLVTAIKTYERQNGKVWKSA